MIMSDDSCCVSVGCYIENNLVIPLAMHGKVIKRCLKILRHIMGVNGYISLQPFVHPLLTNQECAIEWLWLHPDTEQEGCKPIKPSTHR